MKVHENCPSQNEELVAPLAWSISQHYAAVLNIANTLASSMRVLSITAHRGDIVSGFFQWGSQHGEISFYQLETKRKSFLN